MMSAATMERAISAVVIEVGTMDFFGGLDWDAVAGIDQDATIERYRTLLEQRLAAVYPEARVAVDLTCARSQTLYVLDGRGAPLDGSVLDYEAVEEIVLAIGEDLWDGLIFVAVEEGGVGTQCAQCGRTLDAEDVAGSRVIGVCGPCTCWGAF